jgi:hypothetical protein
MLIRTLDGYSSKYISILQVRSVEVKEALRLQKENNFVILDVRPEAEFKEVIRLLYVCDFKLLMNQDFY